MNLTETISPAALKLIDDVAEFVRLPAERQERISKRLVWVAEILASSKSIRADLVHAASISLGVSCTTVRRIIREFKEGGWEALDDARGYYGEKMPEEFKDFVRGLHIQCQRSTTGREVHRMLIERWRLWKKSGDAKHALPGYDKPPVAGSKGYPEGWSEDSIMRLRPDDYSLTVARQGGKAAAKFLPSILKTRVGTRFGQIVFFDDQDYDIKVAAPGFSQRAIRPQGFNCLDYHSGCFMHHAIRLRWWDKKHEQYRTLTQQDFVWFVISYLQKHGYRRDEKGTTFVFEHGTATGYSNRELCTFGGHSNFDEALFAVSHGCIRVERSGLFNQPAFGGMLFRPQSSGNPNFKAPLESMFNLVRNRMAALPGATGRNRNLKPAEQYGVDHYTGQMLKLWEELDERHRAMVRLPMLTASEFAELAGILYQAINARTDHKLEGWEALGFLALQFRFTPDERSPWMSREEVAKLPDNVQGMLLANSEVPGHVRPWQMSPADVAGQYAGELTKLPDHTIPLLIPKQWARPAVVKSNREISIKDQLLGPEAFNYVCRFEDNGSFRVLQPGTTVLCYLNPYAPERLAVCNSDGSFLGTLRQKPRAGWLDQDAILEQLKERAELKADLDTAVRPHLDGLIEERADMKRTNERLAAGKPVLPDDVAAARAESARDGVRTRKRNAISEALGREALAASNLLPQEEEDDGQEPGKSAANPFSASQLLTPTHNDNE